MRVVVMGYHNMGHDCLAELLAAGADVAAVVTHEDDPNEEIFFRSVRELAEKNGVPVFIPKDVNAPEFVARLKEIAPDFIFSFYFRSMLKREILDIPSKGAINLHGSLLPKYRGRCPANWAILHGETQSGVTLHYMVAKPDAGDIVAQKVVDILPEDTAGILNDKLAEAGRLLMRETWPLLRDGRAPRIPQNHAEATYFGGRKPEDGRIDWKMTAKEINNLVRAVTHPYPGAFAFVNGRKFLIWKTKPLEAAGTPGKVYKNGTTGVLEIGAAKGRIAVLSANFEGEPEMPGSELIKKYPEILT